ncbi:MAG TPA: carboxypeptidase-like regulatory domain-containing protein [Bryobacteraceae bacterium]|jgi:hypothetical protein|nr:carboxypeptidase-like regulatory domain-containing protein [Bryobacteraceae bacterium]
MRTALIAICLAAVSVLAFAQSNQGSIAGTIFDRIGRMVQSAPVELMNVETGAKFDTATDRTGAWMLSLPRGTYVLSIEVAGMKYTQNSIVITPEHPLRHDVTLALP